MRSMKTISLTRKELYDLIWSLPMSSVSKKYEISSARLRGICKKMNIPIPEIGYWQKLQYGKQVVIKELPNIDSYKNEITYNVNNENIKIKSSEISIRNKLINEIETNKKIPISVSSKLTNPDILIKEAKDSLTVDKRSNGDYNGLKSTQNGFINIVVAPENIGRALRFMDALIKLLRARGHDIIINQGTTYAVIFGEQIVICLQEKLRIEYTVDKYNWRNRQYFPSGILMFRMWQHFWWHQKVCMDGKLLIEDQLAKILASLELYAKKEIEEKIRREEERKKREEERIILIEKERIEKEHKKRIKKEFLDFKELFVQANRFHQANILRNYIQLVETSAKEGSGLSEEYNNWILWAKQKVEWYDPMINKEDQLLNERHKKVFKDFLKYE